MSSSQHRTSGNPNHRAVTDGVRDLCAANQPHHANIQSKPDRHTPRLAHLALELLQTATKATAWARARALDRHHFSRRSHTLEPACRRAGAHEHPDRFKNNAIFDFVFASLKWSGHNAAAQSRCVCMRTPIGCGSRSAIDACKHFVNCISASWGVASQRLKQWPCVVCVFVWFAMACFIMCAGTNECAQCAQRTLE